MTTVELIYYAFFFLAIIAFHIGLWRIFEKAGYVGWHALVPVLNYWVLLKVVGKPKWWLILYFIPIVNLVVPFLLIIEVCKSFGKLSLGAHTLAMLFPYGYFPYLGFSRSVEYKGPGAIIYKGVRKSPVREWGDAIVFALIAATFIRTFFVEAYKIPTSSMERSMLVGDHLFVSKFHYGARFPITPLAFPLAHHTLPVLNTKAYWDVIQLPYFRFPALMQVKRNDAVVFNFPEGDTVVIAKQDQSYYDLVAMRNGQRFPADQITVRPVDKKENYVKRCVAVAGDTLEIREAQLFINGKPANEPEKIQFTYRVVTSQPLNERFFEQLDLRMSESGGGGSLPGDHGLEYYINASPKAAERMKQMTFVKQVDLIQGTKSPEFAKGILFPNDYKRYPWDLDNYGPVWIPKKGVTIDLTMDNLPFYKRVIKEYEGHTLEVKDGQIWIDGQAGHHLHLRHELLLDDGRQPPPLTGQPVLGICTGRPHCGYALVHLVQPGVGEQ
jgi:signal peptidase I